MSDILIKIRKLNDQIVTAITENDLDLALTISQQRHEQIQQYFERNMDVQNPVEIQTLVNEIEHCDRNAVIEISRAKKAIVKDSLAITKSHHAANQYHNVQSG